jgi:molybdenum cofactor cytidylyltransferase
MTKTVVVEAAVTSQNPIPMTTSPARAAIQTGASNGRRRKLAYSLRMLPMIARPWVVLLAAGGARRFNGPKQLARVGPESLLRRASRVALASEPAGCVVVLGAHAARLRKELTGVPVKVVVNRKWRQGLASSLVTGIDALPRSARSALVILADQAALGPAELVLLAAASRARPGAIVATLAGDVLGPPAVLPRDLFRAVRRLRGDQGARELLRDPARKVVAVELPNAAFDVDRPADVGRLRHARARARTPRSAGSSPSRRPRSSGGT